MSSREWSTLPGLDVVRLPSCAGEALHRALDDAMLDPDAVKLRHEGVDAHPRVLVVVGRHGRCRRARAHTPKRKDQAYGRRAWPATCLLRITTGVAPAHREAMASATIVGAFESSAGQEDLGRVLGPGDRLYGRCGRNADRDPADPWTLRRRRSPASLCAASLATGLVVGLLIGAAFLPFAVPVWGHVAVASAVALALVASCSTATIAAWPSPSRFRGSAWIGSGPLATVIQDLLSIAAYLAIATATVF